MANIEIDNQTEGEAIICAICQDEIADEHRSIIDVCLHDFCDTCLIRWVNESRTTTPIPKCPLCRASFESATFATAPSMKYFKTQITLSAEEYSSLDAPAIEGLFNNGPVTFYYAEVNILVFATFQIYTPEWDTANRVGLNNYYKLTRKQQIDLLKEHHPIIVLDFD